jgi:hypothetical protein
MFFLDKYDGADSSNDISIATFHVFFIFLEIKLFIGLSAVWENNSH